MIEHIDELTLAKLAALAYLDPVDYHGTLLDEFRWQPIHNGDSECFIAYTNRTAIVVFRGTELSSRFDVLSDVRLLFPRRRHFNQGRIHRGFDNYVDRVRRDLYRNLTEARPKQIICTGHSLGAAAATIFAGDAIETRICDGPVFLCTFGSPRVGTEDWADEMNRRLNGRVYRFVHGLDAVCRMPPPFWWPLPRYRHVGQPYLMTRETIIEDPDRAERLMAAFWGTRKHQFITDHSAHAYQKRIEKWHQHRRTNRLSTIINIKV